MYDWTIHSRTGKQHDVLYREQDVQEHIVTTERRPVQLGDEMGNGEEEKAGLGR